MQVGAVAHHGRGLGHVAGSVVGATPEASIGTEPARQKVTRGPAVESRPLVVLQTDDHGELFASRSFRRRSQFLGGAAAGGGPCSPGTLPMLRPSRAPFGRPTGHRGTRHPDAAAPWPGVGRTTPVGWADLCAPVPLSRMRRGPGCGASWRAASASLQRGGHRLGALSAGGRRSGRGHSPRGRRPGRDGRVAHAAAMAARWAAVAAVGECPGESTRMGLSSGGRADRDDVDRARPGRPWRAGRRARVRRRRTRCVMAAGGRAALARPSTAMDRCARTGPADVLIYLKVTSNPR